MKKILILIPIIIGISVSIQPILDFTSGGLYYSKNIDPRFSEATINGFAITPLVIPNVWASCAAEINYDSVLKESELAFIGTVTRLDNYDGPQKVTFFIHEVIKGEIDTPKHVLENTGLVFLENDTIMSSSVSVDYKIGKTYKVYVTNGDTNQCTTKITAPPDGYMWQPGPEDGNYYSEKPVPVKSCEEGYGLSDGVCITLEEMNKDLPICDPNPKHDFGKCKQNTEEPDNKLQDVLDNCSCQESGQNCIQPELRWWNATHFIDNIDCEYLDRDAFGAPPPEPKPETVKALCESDDVVLIDGVCQKIVPQNSRDDAPFFGIFVYLENLFSWIFGSSK